MFDLFMAPSSQRLEPPQNPGRFNLLEKMHNPDNPDRAERPALRDEVRAKLTPAEIGTLQAIFKKLDLPYLAADTVSGLYAPPALPAQ